ncbi:MAG: hypothetical protein EOP50_20980 [Sphingobacteriales bacterium]|nr:MAG: hypothetical protein EOP50_20980 [Sphingobacteriales bacterium]
MLIVLFFGATSFILFKVALREYDQGLPFGKSLAGAVFILAFALYGIHYQVRHFPRIRIDGYGITLRRLYGTEQCSWPEVAAIDVLVQHPLRYLWVLMPQPAALIQGKDASQRVIWADHYRNSDELRRVLHGVKEILARDSHPSYPLPLVDAPAPARTGLLGTGGSARFGGNWIFSSNGITSLLLFGFTVWLVSVIAGKGGAIWIPLLVMLPQLFLICFMLEQLYFFELNERELVVRHHVKWWYRRVYPCEDIVAAAQEQPQKRSIGLRITDRWFHSKWYPAGSLRDRTWEALREQLAQQGIGAE